MIGVCRFELSRWIPLHFYPAEHWMTCILCLYGNSCSLEYPSVSRSPWRHLLGSLPSLLSVLSGITTHTSSVCVSMEMLVLRGEWVRDAARGATWLVSLRKRGFGVAGCGRVFLAGWQQTASGVNRVLTDSLPSVTQQSVVDTRRLSLSID